MARVEIAKLPRHSIQRKHSDQQKPVIKKLKAKNLRDSLWLAYRRVLQSGDAILAYDPEKDLSSLDEAMDLLEKIGLLYIDYQLLVAAKRQLIRQHLQTLKSASYATYDPRAIRQPRLKK